MPFNQLNGLTVELVHETLIEQVSFKGSSVIATLGTKHDALCAPILTMHLDKQESLVFTGAHVVLRWEQLAISEQEIKVLRNGQAAIYRILSRTTKPRRYLP